MSEQPPSHFNPPPMFGLRLDGDAAWEYVLSKPRPNLDAFTRELTKRMNRGVYLSSLLSQTGPAHE